MFIAELAGIEIFATGGIGGVHRGAEETFDISADLVELARTKVAVVCAGAKSILDIEKTLEYLESQGVAVCRLPLRRIPRVLRPLSGLKLDHRCDGAARSRAHGPPAARDRPRRPVDRQSDPRGSRRSTRARSRSASPKRSRRRARKGVVKKEVTPYLLGRIVELTEGRSLEANMALVKNNAALAAQSRWNWRGSERATPPGRLARARRRRCDD